MLCSGESTESMSPGDAPGTTRRACTRSHRRKTPLWARAEADPGVRSLVGHHERQVFSHENLTPLGMPIPTETLTSGRSMSPRAF